MHGNIERLPAMKKDVFLELLTLELEDNVGKIIVEEINSEIDYRIDQLIDLQDLFSSKNYEEILHETLK